MLVLTRLLNQKVILHHRETGERIEVLVADLRAGKVRLGFEAETHWAIDREEIHDLKQAIQQETRREKPE